MMRRLKSVLPALIGEALRHRQDGKILGRAIGNLRPLERRGELSRFEKLLELAAHTIALRDERRFRGLAPQ